MCLDIDYSDHILLSSGERRCIDCGSPRPHTWDQGCWCKRLADSSSAAPDEEGK